MLAGFLFIVGMIMTVALAVIVFLIVLQDGWRKLHLVKTGLCFVVALLFVVAAKLCVVFNLP